MISTNKHIKNLEIFANDIRIDVLRHIKNANSSHISSCFSVVDIITYLYCNLINISPKIVNDPNRDIFILSKGHAGLVVYSVLAKLNFFDAELLKEYYKDNSIFSGHISHKNIPGVEFSTGSLGHGLGVATGFALASKLLGKHNKIYVLLSDGECDEGSTWEAILFASQHKLDNLIAIIDYNKQQALGSTIDILNLEPFALKWQSFGWKTFKTNGHDFKNIKEVFDDVQLFQKKPSVIIADTIKGKGVTFFENNSLLWHYRCPNDSEYLAALKELQL